MPSQFYRLDVQYETHWARIKEWVGLHFYIVQLLYTTHSWPLVLDYLLSQQHCIFLYLSFVVISLSDSLIQLLHSIFEDSCDYTVHTKIIWDNFSILRSTEKIISNYLLSLWSCHPTLSQVLGLRLGLRTSHYMGKGRS